MLVCSSFVRFGTITLLMTALAICGCSEQKSDEEVLLSIQNSGAKVQRNRDREVISIECDIESQVDDAILEDVKGMDKLEILNLNFSTKVTDKGLRNLKGMQSLKKLFLSRVQGITDDGLKHIKHLTNLEELSLAHTRTSDVGLHELVGLSNLRSLVLSGTRVTDAGVKQLMQALPNCSITQ